jgi:hypothetical protein
MPSSSSNAKRRIHRPVGLKSLHLDRGRSIHCGSGKQHRKIRVGDDQDRVGGAFGELNILLLRSRFAAHKKQHRQDKKNFV